MRTTLSVFQFTRQLQRSRSNLYCNKNVACAKSSLNSIREFSATKLVSQRKFTKEHEWIKLDDSSQIGTIGISRYASNALGDVVYVELPKTDMEVTAGDTVGAVESVKSASDIMTPLSGKIVEANTMLEEKPATINKSPEEDGWIAKLQVANKTEFDGLMSDEEYKKFLEETS